MRVGQKQTPPLPRTMLLPQRDANSRATQRNHGINSSNVSGRNRNRRRVVHGFYLCQGWHKHWYYFQGRCRRRAFSCCRSNHWSSYRWFPTGFSIPVGNGWYRVGFTGSVVGTNFRPEVRTSSTDYIYLWGAQLEQSSTVGEYVKTTSSISGAPRFDHDPETGRALVC